MYSNLFSSSTESWSIPRPYSQWTAKTDKKLNVNKPCVTSRKTTFRFLRAFFFSYLDLRHFNFSFFLASRIMNNLDDNKFIKTRFGNHKFLSYSFSTSLSFRKAVFHKVTQDLFTFNAAPFNYMYFLSVLAAH